ncbi:PREDICTED: aspartic proteinase CDR1-like [Nelumbo nucifera]|uniref:Aspartic proteinase CDR1-like n=2 Tax=Nelumbo nucifera TaxID=4432 RepID=A0A1U7YXJ2_NELNU|nr:PREDICTED: aspartic proteinase CDR1-like [Nelumbo nucifera]DAD24949.1 TPA_asm: hypothetical protein HUJ06_026413 [Nelumbo nucifera]
MATMSSSRLFFVVIAVSICLSCFSLIEAGNGGFRVDLIHRDSPLSPLYIPSASRSELLRNAFRRSISRANHFNTSKLSPDGVQSTIYPDSGTYLMKISIGTPPVEMLAIADTGSDLIWTQCKPCDYCFHQTSPLFDPKNSSTYRDLSCNSKPCDDLNSATCSSSGACEYMYKYGDQSFTNGLLASETVTMDSTSGKPVALPKVVFGCGHNNGGTFDKLTSGLVGLGGGSLSLVSQLGSSIGGKFSYCLAPLSYNATSKLNFGSAAVVSGEGAVSTPLVSKSPDTFYYLTLEGVSVGEKKLAYKKALKSSNDVEEGNIIIDSGTTLTMIPPDFYEEVESAVKSAIDLEPVPDPHRLLTLCYRTAQDFDVPPITVHFTGADVVLKPINTFVKLEEDLVCFVMIPSNDLAIFGNLSQMNFLVGYDSVDKKVTFMPADCSKH